MTLSLLLSVLLMQAVAPTKGGTVEGSVRGTNGSPVALVRVGVMAVPEAGRGVSGAGTLVSQTDTDDSGKFRMEDVPPGRYYIVAGRLQNPTFYPGVSDMSAAKTIQVLAGATVRDIHIQVVGTVGAASFSADAGNNQPRFRLIALVQEDSTDRLLADETVELVHPSGEVLKLPVNAQGMVTFPRLLPGIFTLRLASSSGFEVAEKKVVVTDSSVQVELRARKKP